MLLNIVAVDVQLTRNAYSFKMLIKKKKTLKASEAVLLFGEKARLGINPQRGLFLYLANVS